MRIGVVPNLDPIWGGTYQYAMTLVSVLDELDLNDEFILFLYVGHGLPPELAHISLRTVEMRTTRGLAGAMWSTLSRVFPSGLRDRVRRLIGGRIVSGDSDAFGAGGSRPVDPVWARWFAQFDLDLLVFTADNVLSFQSGVPYVAAVHDLQHRLHPDFAEVSANGEAERREYRIGNCVRNATLLLVDSEVGKEDMLDFYGPDGVTADDVHIVPFLPAAYLKPSVSAEEKRAARAKYGLPETYLFYPVQFQPSKNHKRIIEAIALLKGEGKPVHLALAGPHTEPLRERTFAEAMETVKWLGVDDLVHYLGYLPSADMSPLFAGAAGLVMPTFFGPTNIPVIEAWSLGCPVITSDIRGIREQAGDAAILVDPKSVTSIARGIERLLDDSALAETLVRNGYERLHAYTREDFIERFTAALNEAGRRVTSKEGM